MTVKSPAESIALTLPTSLRPSILDSPQDPKPKHLPCSPEGSQGEGFNAQELKSTDTGKLGLNKNCPEVVIKELKDFQYLNNFQSTPRNITKH